MADSDQQTFWNGRYASEDYLFGTQPNVFLAREAHRIAPGSKVLAIADGEGRNSVFLAQHGYQLVATDISERALDKARRLAQRRGVHIDYRWSIWQAGTGQRKSSTLWSASLSSSQENSFAHVCSTGSPQP
jgi:2-polyprenyl-3-methyl-5-hydroxy-6-metoxy-1,4-benzoquinol methylase